MKHLAEQNLFSHHFVIGAFDVSLYDNDKGLKKTVKEWINFKDNNFLLKRYRSDRTKYIDYYKIIDFDKLKYYVHRIYKTYKNKYPYSDVNDFIENVFRYTIFDLERFIERDYYYLATPNPEHKFDYYTYYDGEEFIDIGIQKGLDVDYYKQYFKRVLEYLKIGFVEEIMNEKEDNNTKQNNVDKWNFSVLEWATIFYYAYETKLLSDEKNTIEKIKQFLKQHNIATTINSFKNKYYEAKKRINEKNDYPISKLKKIIPFLTKNYPETVTKLQNDIEYLEDEKNNLGY